jgi:hypothetical protein
MSLYLLIQLYSQAHRHHQKARRESAAVADIDFDGMSDGMSDGIAEDEHEDDGIAEDEHKDENAE